MPKTTPVKYPVMIRSLSKGEGGGYLAEVPDLPGCMADGETPEEAFREAQDAIASYLASVAKHGDTIPKPAGGVWRQRAPRYLKQSLESQAKREGVSFNTFVVSLLAEGMGRRSERKSSRKAVSVKRQSR